MAEQPKVEDKLGAGIDRTVIRQLLVLTPAQRMKALVQSSRNVAELMAKLRRS